MKKYLLLTTLFLLAVGSVSAQKKNSESKSTASAVMDAPPMQFNLREMGFGAQGVGMIACQYLTVTNNTLEDISLTEIHVGTPVFTVPTPSKSMMPVTIPAKRTMTISICFTPDKAGEFRSRIRFKTSDNDTVSIPVWGTGVRREDLDKLPKTDLTVTPANKGKEARISLRLAAQARVTLQIYDALGLLVAAYFNNEVVNPGTYDHIFKKTARGSAPEPGTYYARLIYTEVNVGREQKISKMFSIK